MNWKTRSFVSLTFVTLATASNSQAIYVPVQHNIKTPYGNATYTTQQYVGQMNYGTYTPQISKKYKFTVVLKNDRVHLLKRQG